MAKSPRSAKTLQPQLERVAEDMGLELIDIELAKEHGSIFLRLFIDKSGSPDLTDCERYHRAIMPMMEDIEYDYLEVSTPGIDRPLKNQRDFDRSIGKRVEARLYKPGPSGEKSATGELAACDGDTLTLDIGQVRTTYSMKDIAQVRLAPDISRELLEGTET